MSEALELHHVAALSIFASYFSVIVWLFSKVLESIQATRTRREKPSSKIRLHWGLTVASFAHTWFHMFQYMAWSFHNYEAGQTIAASTGMLHRIASWLVNTTLFEQAWAAVCQGKLNWAWSEQLCLFTAGAWTVFLYVEGSRHQIKHVWAYMVLGQLVAISVASNLFYIAVLSSQLALSQGRAKDAVKIANVAEAFVPAKLWAPVVISLTTIGISPFTNDRTFLPNLLVMHALLVVPLISVTPLRTTKSWWNLSIFYLVIFLAAIPIRSRTLLAAASSLPTTGPTADPSALGFFKAQWKVLHSHPAQSSIGWDVVWTSVSFVVWTALQPSQASQSVRSRLFTVPYLFLATPFASVGITAPYVLRPRSGDGESDEVKEE